MKMATEAKRQKVSDDNEDLQSLKDFKVSKVLSEDSDTKKILLQGNIDGDSENSAVLILEKMPFKTESVQEILSKSSLKTEFKNDIYMNLNIPLLCQIRHTSFIIVGIFQLLC